MFVEKSVFFLNADMTSEAFDRFNIIKKRGFLRRQFQKPGFFLLIANGLIEVFVPRFAVFMRNYGGDLKYFRLKIPSLG